MFPKPVRIKKTSLIADGKEVDIDEVKHLA
jgi:hypothetical protein